MEGERGNGKSWRGRAWIAAQLVLAAVRSCLKSSSHALSLTWLRSVNTSCGQHISLVALRLVPMDGAVEPLDAPIWFTPLPQEAEDYHASVSLHSSMPVQRRVFRKLQAHRFVRSTVRSWHHCPQQQRVISVFVEIVRANCLACVKMFACCLDSNLT